MSIFKLSIDTAATQNKVLEFSFLFRVDAKKFELSGYHSNEIKNGHPNEISVIIEAIIPSNMSFHRF